ncbi:MAG: hypothetical protein J0M02_07430 [Planctomycetes bacterium]|nr:hypothetical protein [Planctomycetota bacterium]
MAESNEALAEWRARVLDAHIAGRPLLPPADLRDACRTWLDEACPNGPDGAIGVAGVPEAWADTLGWSGVPLAAGPLHWGADLRQDAVEAPTLRDGVLLLPPPEDLVGLTSLSLKPLRLFVAERLGCRLQAAPGIRVWLWPDRAALQSLSPIPLAGFLYGRATGHRSGVALEPWGCQVVTW